MLDLLTKTMTLEAYQGEDEEGVVTYGSSLGVACRFEYSDRLFIASDGEQKQADAIAFVASSVAVDLRARATYDSKTFRVERVGHHEDLDGPLFKQLILQKLA